MPHSDPARKSNPYRSIGWADAFMSERTEAEVIAATSNSNDKNVVLDAMVASRLDDGFVWHGGTFSQKYYRKPFKIKGLPSDEEPLLKCFVSKTAMAFKGLKSGSEKDRIEPAKRKILALDDPYVTVNAEMRGVIRIDLDAAFDSIEAMRLAIAACLSEHSEIPVMPNLAVGYKGPTGRFLRPHLIWLLQDSVCFTANGRVGPQRLMRQVERGLCAALVELGADPGALSNNLRLKNPVSPFWDTEIIAGEPYRLADMAGSVDLSVTEHSLIKQLRTSAAPEGIETATGEVVTSNSIFNALQAYAFSKVDAFQSKGRPSDFHEAIELHALSIAGSDRKARRQATAVAARVFVYVWGNYDPNRKQQDRRNRGLLADEVIGLNMSERQALGGQCTASRRREASLSACRNAVIALRSQNVKVTQGAVAIAAQVSERTVRSLWSVLKG